jgi:DNA-binding PadR family transcriptional regulator
MTVKEIIDKAIAQSQDRWRPSPSTIYPILGKLLDEGLADESEDGRYSITRKGLDMVANLHSSATKAIQKQMKILFRTGKLGRFMAMDLVDRARALASTLNSNLDKLTEEEEEKYRQFLQDELNKLDEEEDKKR